VDSIHGRVQGAIGIGMKWTTKSLLTMPFNGRPHCIERRKKNCSTAARHNTLGERRYADQAKAAVMEYVQRLARDEFARCSAADNGVIELTLSSGEVFHLGKTSITRIV
jgi:hypothetical protein